MRICCFFTIILFILFGCAEKEKPPIEPTKMVKILVDVHLAEAAMQEMTGMQRDSIGKKYYSKIFDLHHVSEPDFNKSLLWYKKDPDQMEQLYKEVLTELQAQEKAAQ